MVLFPEFAEMLRSFAPGSQYRRKFTIPNDRTEFQPFFFYSPESFAMIRGGPIDTTIIAGLQLYDAGIWQIGQFPVNHFWGLVVRWIWLPVQKKMIITMMHTERDGTSKIVQLCDLPLTALKSVDMVITDLAVFKYIAGKLTLIEVTPGATLKEVREKTEADFEEKLA